MQAVLSAFESVQNIGTVSNDDTFPAKREHHKQTSTFVNAKDMEFIMELVDEVSDEIDHEYKDTESNEPQNNEHHQPALQDEVDELKRPNTPQKAMPDRMAAQYVAQAILGRGVSSTVYLVQSKSTHRQYALKQMSRSDPLNRQSYRSEVSILRQCNHPNIVRIHDAQSTKTHFFITSEHCAGGTLLHQVARMKRLSESHCVDFLKSILHAVEYIHSKSIVHRDLKLENIVFDNTNPSKLVLKLIDFGQSEKIVNLSQTERNIVGSLPYLAPEAGRIRLKRHLFAGDMWAIGVIAFVLLQGKFPYRGDNVQSHLLLIRKRKLNIWDENIPISQSCKDFVEHLLCPDYRRRYTAKQALNHPWLTQPACNDHLGDGLLTRLCQYNCRNELRKMMLQVAWTDLTSEERKIITDFRGYQNDDELVNQILSGYTPTGRRVSRNSISLSTTASSTFSPQTLVLLPEVSELTYEESEETVPDSNMDVDGILHEIDCDISSMQSPPLRRQQSVTSPNMNDTINVVRFVDILSRVPSKCDVSRILREVTHNGAEPITYEKIASYYGPGMTI